MTQTNRDRGGWRFPGPTGTLLLGLTFAAGMLVQAAIAWPGAMAAPPPPASGSVPVAPAPVLPCAQWETAFAPVGTTASPVLPRLGEVVPVKGPEGAWEPFAFAPNGQLVFRRCVTAPR